VDVPTRRARWLAGARFLSEHSRSSPWMSGDQRSVVMLRDRHLRKHAGWSDGAPLLAGCREEYHDLQGLIAPGGLAIRSCDPHICVHPDQPSRLVGVRGDFQRKGSACSNLSSIVQKRPSTASWSRLRSAPRKAVNFKKWNDASLRWRIRAGPRGRSQQCRARFEP